jgi:hypothetical protein
MMARVPMGIRPHRLLLSEILTTNALWLATQAKTKNPHSRNPKFELKHVRREKEENDWEIPQDLGVLPAFL